MFTCVLSNKQSNEVGNLEMFQVKYTSIFPLTLGGTYQHTTTSGRSIDENMSRGY